MDCSVSNSINKIDLSRVLAFRHEVFDLEEIVCTTVESVKLEEIVLSQQNLQDMYAQN